MSYNYNSTYRNYFYETGHTKTLLFVSYNMKVTAVSGKPPKIENKNRWKSTKAYASGDIAVEGDRRYTCISPNTGNQPSTSPTYWNDIGEELNTIITNDNIDKENFEYSMSINSAKNLCIGSCEAAGIKIRIKNDGRIVPLVSHENDSYEETIFNVYLYFDDNSDTLMYFGMFQCNKDEVTSDFKFRDITMYDQMSVLRDLDVYQWFTRFTEKYPNCTVKQLRDGLFEVLNTNNEEYAYIRMPIDQKSKSLVHDSSTYKYRLDEGATKLSAANLLEDICEINGVWGRFGRSLNSEGRVEFEYIELPTINSSYKVPTKDKITSNMRERYVKHDWYRTRVIGKISVYNAYSECIGWRAKGDINIYDEKHTKKIGEKAEYAIYDNKFFDEVRKGSESNDLSKFLDDILTKVENITYEPYEIRCIGDPVREPGDVIFIEGTDDEIADTDPRKEYTSFKSYIFNRTLKGIQVMKDEYSATGDRRMPVFGDSSTSSAYSSGSTNGVYRPSSSSSFVNASGEGEQLNIPELIRNWGFRLLEIPSAGVTFDKDTGVAKIFWQDPDDITDNKPVPSYWDGTLLVRSHEKPLNRWQEGVTVLDDFKIRNEHTTEETAYEDEHAGDYDIVYYGLFPYDVKGDYNPFKILKVVTNNVIAVPKITDITEIEARSVKVNYVIPDGNYEYIKLVYKVNEVPGSVTDGSVINITGSGVTVSGLEPNTKYYFKIFMKGTNKAKSESNAVDCTTVNLIVKELINIDARRGDAHDTAGDKWPASSSSNWQISNGWFTRINHNDYDGRGYMDYWGGGGWNEKNPNDFKNCKLCVEMKVRMRGNPTYGCYPMLSIAENGTSRSAHFIPAGYQTGHTYYDWNVCGRSDIGGALSLSDRGLTRCATKAIPLRDKTGEFVVKYEIDVTNNLLGNGKIYVNGALYDTLYVNNPKFLHPFYYVQGASYVIADYRVQFGDNFDIQYVKLWGEI